MMPLIMVPLLHYMLYGNMVMSLIFLLISVVFGTYVLLHTIFVWTICITKKTMTKLNEMTLRTINISGEICQPDLSKFKSREIVGESKAFIDHITVHFNKKYAYNDNIWAMFFCVLFIASYQIALLVLTYMLLNMLMGNSIAVILTTVVAIAFIVIKSIHHKRFMAVIDAFDDSLCDKLEDKLCNPLAISLRDGHVGLTDKNML